MCDVTGLVGFYIRILCIYLSLPLQSYYYSHPVIESLLPIKRIRFLTLFQRSTFRRHQRVSSVLLARITFYEEKQLPEWECVYFQDGNMTPLML